MLVKLTLVLLILQSVLSQDKTFYELLEVDREFTPEILKSAFRAKSKQYHPDRNRGDDTARQMFVRVNRAYEVLADPEKRKIYDIYGEAGLDDQK